MCRICAVEFREGVVHDPFGALLTWNEDYEEVNPSYGLEWSAQEGQALSQSFD